MLNNNEITRSGIDSHFCCGLNTHYMLNNNETTRSGIDSNFCSGLNTHYMLNNNETTRSGIDSHFCCGSNFTIRMYVDLAICNKPYLQYNVPNSILFYLMVWHIFFISQNKYPNLLNKVRGFGLYGAVDLPDQSSRDKVMTKLREQGEIYNHRLIVTFYDYLLSIVFVVFTTIHLKKLMSLILDIYGSLFMVETLFFFVLSVRPQAFQMAISPNVVRLICLLS